jgi:hypothetical protein
VARRCTSSVSEMWTHYLFGVPKCGCFKVGVSGRACVGDDGCLEPVLAGVDRGLNHAAFGCSADQNEAFYLQLFEEDVERRVVEAGVAMFEQDIIARKRSEFLDDLATARLVDSCPDEYRRVTVPAIFVVIDIN